MPKAAGLLAEVLTREKFFMFFESGGGEEAAEEKADGAVEAGFGFEAEAFEGPGLHEALHGVEEKFAGENGADVIADGAAELTFLDETAEDVGQVFGAGGEDVAMERGSVLLQVGEDGGAELGEAIDHALGEAAEFFGELKTVVAEEDFGVGADFGGEAIDDGADHGVLARVVHVEGFLAHAECGGEVVHREGGVAAGEKEGAGFEEDAGGRRRFADRGACAGRGR
jgi:hypothetical protein